VYKPVVFHITRVWLPVVAVQHPFVEIQFGEALTGGTKKAEMHTARKTQNARDAIRPYLGPLRLFGSPLR
jgi:hypothetical protein